MLKALSIELFTELRSVCCAGSALGMRQTARPAAQPATACRSMVRMAPCDELPLDFAASFESFETLMLAQLPRVVVSGWLRLQCPGEQWIAIDGDRHTCLECLATMVRNTADCQPLYDDVLSLYASFGMPLPTRPPLLLVSCLQPLLKLV